MVVDGHDFSRPQHEASVGANTQPNAMFQVNVLFTNPSLESRVSKMLLCEGEDWGCGTCYASGDTQGWSSMNIASDFS